MRILWRYIRKYWVRYLLGIFTLFAVDLLSLYIPELTGEVTDGLESGAYGMAEVGRCVTGILVVGLGMVLGRFGWRYFLNGTARKIEHEIRNDLFGHLSKLSTNYYNEHKTGDLMAHFTNDIASIRAALGPAIITTFDAVIMTVMVITKMIFHVNLGMTLLACIPMVFILVGAIRYGKAVEKRFGDKQHAFSTMTDEVQESISGVRVIKAFVQERREIKAFAKANRHNMEMNLKVIKLNTIVMPILDFTIGVSALITLLYGGWLVVNDSISLGQFVAFNQYIGMLVWPMIAAGDSINFFSQGSASVKRINKILGEEPEIVDGENVKNIDRLEGDIEINGLSFAYKTTGCQVLKDVSVKIPKGSTLAVIGRTGSGKTTFANLLLRLYDAEDGMIKLDGNDIKEIPLSVLRKQIAYVPQDNFLFSDTVQANIAFGVRDVIELPEEKLDLRIFKTKSSAIEDVLENDLSEMNRKIDEMHNDLEQVEEAAKLACVHDNIIEFPLKYRTLVGERGVTMSGGQKQRSSIARALMKDSPILILDDALSAVDTDTEERILENLKQNRADKTTIIIAHRISTIQNADKILVLDDGKVAEYGSHDELMKLGGIYERLYEKQQLEKLIENYN